MRRVSGIRSQGSQAAVRGYIKAVDADILTVGRGFWKEQIAFERIQKLTIADSDHEMDQLGRRTGMHSGARGVLNWPVALLEALF